MEPIVKIDIDKLLDEGRDLVVDLGCGSKKRRGRIGIDRVDLPAVDIVADLEQGLGFLPDHSVREIHCRSVLEHLDPFETVLREILRVLKPEGTAHIFVPHFSNPYFYSDPTHIRFFGLYTFQYFVPPELQLRRKVPTYYSDLRLRILSQRLVFRSSFKFINPIKKAFGWLINRHSLLQAYYEETLCWLFPAHGIELIFTHAGAEGPSGSIEKAKTDNTAPKKRSST